MGKDNISIKFPNNPPNSSPGFLILELFNDLDSLTDPSLFNLEVIDLVFNEDP